MLEFPRAVVSELFRQPADSPFFSGMTNEEIGEYFEDKRYPRRK